MDDFIEEKVGNGGFSRMCIICIKSRSDRSQSETKPKTRVVNSRLSEPPRFRTPNAVLHKNATRPSGFTDHPPFRPLAFQQMRDQRVVKIEQMTREMMGGV